MNNAKFLVSIIRRLKSLFHIAAAVYAIAAGRAWAQAPQIATHGWRFAVKLRDGSICFRQRWETALHSPRKVTDDERESWLT